MLHLLGFEKRQAELPDIVSAPVMHVLRSLRLKSSKIDKLRNTKRKTSRRQYRSWEFKLCWMLVEIQTAKILKQ